MSNGRLGVKTRRQENRSAAASRPTLNELREPGKSLRQQCPGSSHAIWKAPTNRLSVAVAGASYTIVVAKGARYYYVGGVHYRAEFYQGRTVDVRVRL